MVDRHVGDVLPERGVVSGEPRSFAGIELPPLNIPDRELVSRLRMPPDELVGRRVGGLYGVGGSGWRRTYPPQTPSLKTCSSAEPPTLLMVWKALVNRFSIWPAASVAVET